MDKNNFLPSEDCIGLLPVESATEVKQRDNEQNGRQEFVRWVELLHFIQTCNVLIVYIC